MVQHPKLAEPDDAVRGGPLLGALLAAAFVVIAVAAEIFSSRYANSPVPGWAYRISPLAWPQPARVVWWLAVAGAMVAFRVLLGRAGLPQRRLVVVISAAPFVIFAAGIAVGAEWSTWH